VAVFVAFVGGAARENEPAAPKIEVADDFSG
jgi:hypothetical protein